VVTVDRGMTNLALARRQLAVLDPAPDLSAAEPAPPALTAGGRRES
jgi:hypothetical protein